MLNQQCSYIFCFLFLLNVRGKLDVLAFSSIKHDMFTHDEFFVRKSRVRGRLFARRRQSAMRYFYRIVYGCADFFYQTYQHCNLSNSKLWNFANFGAYSLRYIETPSAVDMWNCAVWRWRENEDHRNGSHRNGYDLVSDRQKYYSLTPLPENQYASLEHTVRGQRRRDIDVSREQAHRYRLLIDDRCPANDTGSWAPTSISRVDVQVHLRNGSNVVIDNIPFHVVRPWQ